ncbi:zinc ribbon domain-containing protein [Paenibacillus dendritiformis]|uniref:zinc ribbon domain-containing protein n=1 Tax=Paenibacillus dendritiformis TaxID=130049 RepID=UPI001930961F
MFRRGKPRGKLEKGSKREKFIRKFTFSCKLECGFCGKNYSRRSWNSRTVYAKVIWQCVTFSKKGKRYCPHCKGIEETIIEGAFVETYNRVCGNHKDVLDELLLRMESVLGDKQPFQTFK